MARVDYVQLDAHGLMAACGTYMMAPDQLERSCREAVAAERTGGALQNILDDLSERGFEVGHGMSKPLKTAPRGYPKDHPRVDLLRQEGAVRAHRQFTGSQLRDAAAVRRFVADTFDACGPMNDWIKWNIRILENRSW